MNNGFVMLLKKNKKDLDLDIDVFMCFFCLCYYSDFKQLDCFYNFCEGCFKMYIIFKEKKDLFDGKFICLICYILIFIFVFVFNLEIWIG